MAVTEHCQHEPDLAAIARLSGNTLASLKPYRADTEHSNFDCLGRQNFYINSTGYGNASDIGAPLTFRSFHCWSVVVAEPEFPYIPRESRMATMTTSTGVAISPTAPSSLNGNINANGT